MKPPTPTSSVAGPLPSAVSRPSKPPSNPPAPTTMASSLAQHARPGFPFGPHALAQSGLHHPEQLAAAAAFNSAAGPMGMPGYRPVSVVHPPLNPSAPL